jgi:hypothetical protein
MPIKIAPTIPNIQKPSRTENCSTALLLPLDGQWLCMRMVGQRFKNQTWSSHASSGLLLQVICWDAVFFTSTVIDNLPGILEMESNLRRERARCDVVGTAEG